MLHCGVVPFIAGVEAVPEHGGLSRGLTGLSLEGDEPQAGASAAARRKFRRVSTMSAGEVAQLSAAALEQLLQPG